MYALRARLKTKIPEILKHFGVKTFKSNGLLVGSCPIHSGDNATAFNVNVDRASEYCGRWFCNTAGCHKTHGGDLVGLIDGLCQRDGPLPFKDVLDVAEGFCDGAAINYFSDIFNDFVLKGGEISGVESRESVRARLRRPVQYYLDRGFTEKTLDEFDVGICDDPNDEMFNRVVFPIYDNVGKTLVGSVGRTLKDAPDKWKNQRDFKKSECVYGYWKTIQSIGQIQKIILVEGQGDLLKFWQAGVKNVLGIFGSNLSDSQELILQKTGVMDIITVFDADVAGDKCRKGCDRLKKLFNVKHLLPDGNDVGEMSTEQIKGMDLL